MCDRIDLEDGVAGTVDVEVEARAEEVLVVRREEARLELGCGRVLLARNASTGQDNACQFGFELDRAVLVEVPEVAVFVVVDRGDRGGNEATAAPHLNVAIGIGVLP